MYGLLKKGDPPHPHLSAAPMTYSRAQVLEAYRNEPFEFIKKVLRDPAYLEQVSGIAQMKADSEALLDEIDWVGQDDDEDNLL